MSTDELSAWKPVKKERDTNPTAKIKEEIQDMKNNHYESNSQDNFNLSASLATLIGQINNISSRLEKIEANQTSTNWKTKTAASNHS